VDTGAPLQDDEALILRMASHHAEHGDRDDDLARAVLADSVLWGRDLTRLAGVGPAVARQLGRIRRDGILAALQDCLAHKHHA
jgi:predicted flap endonuclease-1-like 5' DNA nuclease